LTARPVIRADGLGKRFGDRWAVRDLSLEVCPGEVFGFLGPNGAGKTTTVRLLAGMIAPTEGTAWIDGVELRGAPDGVRSRIGLLTEAPGLYERLSAEANLMLHARLQGIPRDRRRRRIRECLELVGMADRAREQVAGFSKGMKQKIAIARAVLHEPAAIFLDEPTSGLDPESARDVRALIRDLRAAGRAIFLCTHNLDEARRLCDRVAIFRTRVLRLGTPRDLEREVLGRRLAIRLAEPAEQYASVARAVPRVRDVEVENGQMLVSLDDADEDAPGLVRQLVQAGARIQRVAELDSALEAAYLSIVGGDAAEPGPNRESR
jgi:ABC-2 type transport system ATP-binding protein